LYTSFSRKNSGSEATIIFIAGEDPEIVDGDNEVRQKRPWLEVSRSNSPPPWKLNIWIIPYSYATELYWARI